MLEKGEQQRHEIIENSNVCKLSKSLVIGFLFVEILSIGVGFLVTNKLQHAQHTWIDYLEGTSSNAALLIDIRDAVGYGGFIHQFKNYVVRQDSQRLEKIAAKHTQLSELLEQYRSLVINDNERMSLNTIEGVFFSI